jgi:DNA segregation ATPase FtsK/SpoIIIE, S-DNA-T family
VGLRPPVLWEHRVMDRAEGEGCGWCRFDDSRLIRSAVLAELGTAPGWFRESIAGEDAGRAARRPEPGVWSTLEYLDHVRDVALVQRERVLRALLEERPALAPMHRDERPPRCGYGQSAVEVSLDHLHMATTLLLDVLDRVDEDEWRRGVIYNWPTERIRTVEWVARHTLHEYVHHLADVKAGLGQSAPEPDH